jgi:hypothetical protein
VQDLIQNNLPDSLEPAQDSGMFCYVIPPKGWSAGSKAADALHSSAFFGDANDDPTDPDQHQGYKDLDDTPTRCHYGWTKNDGNPVTLTTLFSHELVEAITDPDGNGIQVTDAHGQRIPSDDSSWSEIAEGKEPQSYTYRLGGLLVQAYWSQKWKPRGSQ